MHNAAHATRHALSPPGTAWWACAATGRARLLLSIAVVAVGPGRREGCARVARWESVHAGSAPTHPLMSRDNREREWTTWALALLRTTPVVRHSTRIPCLACLECSADVFALPQSEYSPATDAWHVMRVAAVRIPGSFEIGLRRKKGLFFRSICACGAAWGATGR